MNPIDIKHITFRPLQETDFSLLLKWQESPHVKKGCGQITPHTIESVINKYQDDINGFKSGCAPQKKIYSYIYCYDHKPIGCIQLYSTHDFDQKKELDKQFPQDTGSIDFYMGEEDFLVRNLGSNILKEFLEKIAFDKYKYIFADQKICNESEIRCFEKAGFEIIKKNDKSFWMVASNKKIRLPIKDLLFLEISFEQSFLINDKLFIFGSRTNLQALGGDLDLYIETHAKSVEEAVSIKNTFIQDLLKHIGDFKIDLVLNILSLKNNLPIYDIAKQQGVLLNEKHS